MINFLSALVKNVLGYLSAFFAGRIYEQKEEAENDAEFYKKEAQKWADAGNEPTPDKLRELARKKRNRS